VNTKAGAYEATLDDVQNLGWIKGERKRKKGTGKRLEGLVINNAKKEIRL